MRIGERRYDIYVPPPTSKSFEEPSTGEFANGQSAHRFAAA
jgi:hypothetical protein